MRLVESQESALLRRKTCAVLRPRTWGAVLGVLGDLGTLWEHFGVTLGGLGYSKGTLGISLCQSIAFHENRKESMGVLLQNRHSGTLTGLAGSCPRSAAQTLPSTRAGGKLPQIVTSTKNMHEILHS